MFEDLGSAVTIMISLVSTWLHRWADQWGGGLTQGHGFQEITLATTSTTSRLKWFLWEMRDRADYI